MNNTLVKINYDDILNVINNKTFTSKYIIEHDDTLSVTYKHINDNPVVLNFANNDYPGCYDQFELKGNTQEEILMKNTTLKNILLNNLQLYPIDSRIRYIRYYKYDSI